MVNTTAQDTLEKNNYAALEERLSELGCEKGTWNRRVYQLSKKEFSKVLAALSEEYTDVPVTFNRVKHIVEIKTVDNEKDLDIMRYSDYKELYGNNDEE